MISKRLEDVLVYAAIAFLSAVVVFCLLVWGISIYEFFKMAASPEQIYWGKAFVMLIFLFPMFGFFGGWMLFFGVI